MSEAGRGPCPGVVDDPDLYGALLNKAEMGELPQSKRERVDGVGTKAPVFIIALLIILVLLMFCVMAGLGVVALQLRDIVADKDLQTLKSIAPKGASLFVGSH